MRACGTAPGVWRPASSITPCPLLQILCMYLPCRCRGVYSRTTNTEESSMQQRGARTKIRSHVYITKVEQEKAHAHLRLAFSPRRKKNLQKKKRRTRGNTLSIFTVQPNRCQQGMSIKKKRRWSHHQSFSSSSLYALTLLHLLYRAHLAVLSLQCRVLKGKQ